MARPGDDHHGRVNDSPEYIANQPNPKHKKTDFRRLFLSPKGDGTRGRTWTGTVLPPSDFESDASTNFATLALSAFKLAILRSESAMHFPMRLPIYSSLPVTHLLCRLANAIQICSLQICRHSGIECVRSGKLNRLCIIAIKASLASILSPG